jgi:hypothetical protein
MMPTVQMLAAVATRGGLTLSDDCACTDETDAPVTTP